jgi:nucleotide-binding universal stress UspA family protein
VTLALFAVVALGRVWFGDVEGSVQPAAVVDARPADGLLALAEEHDAAMIVVGTYSERPLLGVVLGSTAYKLLHRSTIPVLVVPAKPG